MWPSQRLASISLESWQGKAQARRRERRARGIRPIVTLLEERTMLSSIPGTWTAVAPLPTGRVYLGAATGNNGIIYAIGGLVYGDGHTSEVDAYNPATNTWTEVAPLPTAAAGGVTAVTGQNGLIYAIGSGNGDGTDQVDAYNPATNTWTVEAPVPDDASYLAAAVSSNGIIYAIGGATTAGVTNEVEAYNPATDIWTTVAPLPTARAYLAAASSDGIIYAIGGQLNGGVNTGEVDAYSPATNVWTQIASVPIYPSGNGGTDGVGTATTGTDGTIYAFTDGWENSEINTYNQGTNTWTPISNHLYCAYGMAATTGLDGQGHRVSFP